MDGWTDGRMDGWTDVNRFKIAHKIHIFTNYFNIGYYSVFVCLDVNSNNIITLIDIV